MANLKLVKHDERFFVNPLLESTVHEFPLNDEVKSNILACAQNLLNCWEKSIKEEINYTGMWRNYTVYTGISGYALVFLRLGVQLKNEDYLEQAFFLAEKCCMHLHGKGPSFLLGDGGPLAIAAVASRVLRQPEKEQHFIHRLEKMYHTAELLDASPTVPDELLYGRAGALYALLYVQHHGGKVNVELISFIAHAMVESGRRMARLLKEMQPSMPPLMYEWHDKKYLGPAHGVAGIVYLLLQARQCLSHEILDKEIRPTLDFLLACRMASGNLPSSLGNGSDRLVQWCHGAAGLVHCLVLASQVFEAPAYLEAARQCADVVWKRGILTKGFGLCHGMAGNGYAFLHLYQVTGEPVHLHRAVQFGRIIAEAPAHEFRTPDTPSSLYEGSAGPVLYLFDLLRPQTASFPGYQF